MTDPAGPTQTDPEAERRAKAQFAMLNGVRIASLGAVIAGIAGAQNALPIPYALAVALALVGFIAFFFGPYYLARYFKSRK
ncbi:MAG: hypothetical protein AAGL10_11390 [Pseudomonadota bacterium]